MSVKVEVSEEPSAGEDADADLHGSRSSRGSAGQRGVRRPDAQEGPQQPRDQGQRGLEADQDRGDRRVAARGAARSRRPARYTLSAPSDRRPTKCRPTHFEGDVARRRGMGGLAAVDEITMVVMPGHHGPAATTATTPVRDLQGKMIAHCEGAGDRMAILDAPPDLLPQEILEWRMNTAGYDSKFAALYYPWIEVMDPLTNQPMMVPPSGHVAGVWCRTDAQRGVHKAPGQRGRARRQRARLPGHPGRAGRPQQGRHQLHPRVPGPRHPRVGRAHAVERSRVALHQRPPALQLRLRVDHGGHAVDGVRAQRRAAVDAAADRGLELPDAHVA